ncbi:VWA domain-containing protein [Mesorhizobium sp. BAC0120]|uniref:vWA domain-containing protein n=1 Tax=Mesorhizobium sp. BAC0120 TaxID=3090670 RepID=UPI00298D1BB5|nr:VWA domain-containing protein [Mesorhizobium sp. BAC0120]MDW6022886.1 VWA domain-containing protein [Mesorhizobium sp. BAC0120]
MYQLEFPWLLALLPLPLLVWWLLPPYREETASVRIPFFGEVTRAAGISPTQGSIVPRMNWAQRIIAPICWALVVLALARPQFVEPPVEKTEPQRDLMLALDLSQSMDTEDFRSPSGQVEARVDAVRQVVSEFVKRRTGDRIGLIAFGDAPYPMVPFTQDHKTVQAMISGIIPGIAGPRTALGDAIGLAIKMFQASPAPEKVLIVLTDGNDTASKMPPDKAADIAKQNGIVVHTVGIGNPNATGEDKLDTAALQKIAATTGGRYFFGQDQGQLEQIYQTLDRITPANQKMLSWRPTIELFHYPLGAALLLLIAYHGLAWGITTLRSHSEREAAA